MRVAVSLALAVSVVAFGVFVVRRVWIAWKDAGSRWSGGAPRRPSVRSPSDDLDEDAPHDSGRDGERAESEGRA
jgi:hypothetical protein